MNGDNTDIEQWIMFVEFLMGRTIRGLARRYKVKGSEAEEIIRKKSIELGYYVPLKRRKKL